MCAKIFKKSTILSVFSKTDLILYNSEKILKSLHKKLQKSMSVSTSYYLLTYYRVQQIHDLHLIIFQNYMNMLVIYIRLMNILRSQYLLNAGSTVFSMVVLAKL